MSTKPTKKPSKKPTRTKKEITRASVGARRVQDAMVHLAKAQAELDKACRALSAVIGYPAEHRMIASYSRGAKDIYYKLRDPEPPPLSRLYGELDRDPIESDAHAHVPCCGRTKAS